MSPLPRTVLYVDDDDGLVRLVQKGLGRYGYRVEGAATIEAGLARLGQGEIDVVALDHFLASGTGLDFLAELARAGPHPPVVYVTASGEVSIAVEALKAGAADYVPKVVGGEFLELLRRAIEHAVAQARLEQERVQAEQAVREARDRAEALLHEVNHRVANSLALVAALVRLQASSISDAEARAAIEQIQARITAIAGVHRSLYTSSAHVSSVKLPDYLSTLLSELQETVQSPGVGIVFTAPDLIEVSTDRAVSIGVMVTELVTNAIKYAYPDGTGEIRVGLELAGPETVSLTVADDGVGCSEADAPKGTGVGTRVIAAMARALGSAMEYGQGKGCRVSITFAN
jgi:two-component sensor histidine kinase